MREVRGDQVPIRSVKMRAEEEEGGSSLPPFYFAATHFSCALRFRRSLKNLPFLEVDSEKPLTTARSPLDAQWQFLL